MEWPVLDIRKFCSNCTQTQLGNDSVSSCKDYWHANTFLEVESLIRATLIRNGYLAKFIDVHSQQSRRVTQPIKQ